MPGPLFPRSIYARRTTFFRFSSKKVLRHRNLDFLTGRHVRSWRCSQRLFPLCRKCGSLFICSRDGIFQSHEFGLPDFIQSVFARTRAQKLIAVQQLRALVRKSIRVAVKNSLIASQLQAKKPVSKISEVGDIETSHWLSFRHSHAGGDWMWRSGQSSQSDSDASAKSKSKPKSKSDSNRRLNQQHYCCHHAE